MTMVFRDGLRLELGPQLAAGLVGAGLIFFAMSWYQLREAKRLVEGAEKTARQEVRVMEFAEVCPLP